MNCCPYVQRAEPQRGGGDDGQQQGVGRLRPRLLAQLRHPAGRHARHGRHLPGGRIQGDLQGRHVSNV